MQIVLLLSLSTNAFVKSKIIIFFHISTICRGVFQRSAKYMGILSVYLNHIRERECVPEIRRCSRFGLQLKIAMWRLISDGKLEININSECSIPQVLNIASVKHKEGRRQALTFGARGLKRLSPMELFGVMNIPLRSTAQKHEPSIMTHPLCVHISVLYFGFHHHCFFPSKT